MSYQQVYEQPVSVDIDYNYSQFISGNGGDDANQLAMEVLTWEGTPDINIRETPIAFPVEVPTPEVLYPAICEQEPPVTYVDRFVDQSLDNLRTPERMADIFVENIVGYAISATAGAAVAKATRRKKRNDED